MLISIATSSKPSEDIDSLAAQPATANQRQSLADSQPPMGAAKVVYLGSALARKNACVNSAYGLSPRLCLAKPLAQAIQHRCARKMRATRLFFPNSQRNRIHIYAKMPDLYGCCFPPCPVKLRDNTQLPTSYPFGGSSLLLVLPRSSVQHQYLSIRMSSKNSKKSESAKTCYLNGQHMVPKSSPFPQLHSPPLPPDPAPHRPASHSPPPSSPGWAVSAGPPSLPPTSPQTAPPPPATFASRQAAARSGGSPGSFAASVRGTRGPIQ